MGGSPAAASAAAALLPEVSILSNGKPDVVLNGSKGGTLLGGCAVDDASRDDEPVDNELNVVWLGLL